MAKMDKKWVVLCSAAITAVYAAGYMTTPGQASSQEALPSYMASSSPSPAGALSPSLLPTASAAPSSGQTVAPSATPTAKPSQQAAQGNQARASVQPSASPQQKPSATTQTAAPQSQSGSAAAPTASASVAPSGAAYKDGTYTGSGSNRRGSIEVTVTIKNGKITTVDVSRYAMHYSQKDIADLPQEVITNQSAKVKNVSGATYSVQAFQGAVESALSKAQNG